MTVNIVSVIMLLKLQRIFFFSECLLKPLGIKSATRFQTTQPEKKPSIYIWKVNATKC